jgi:hypothetical protein
MSTPIATSAFAGSAVAAASADASKTDRVALQRFDMGDISLRRQVDCLEDETFDRQRQKCNTSPLTHAQRSPSLKGPSR